MYLKYDIIITILDDVALKDMYQHLLTNKIGNDGYRTFNHPHGYFVTNYLETLGFVRISKCGSSTFSHRHELNKWKKFSDAKNISLTLCCLRDPYSRIISSIPETLNRLYCEEIPESKFDWTNLKISKDVYVFLSKKIKADPKSLLYCFQEAINHFGFFDTCHEPMTNFLFSKNGDIEINPYMFTLNKMDKISRLIFSMSNDLQKTKFNKINVRDQNIQQKEFYSFKRYARYLQIKMIKKRFLIYKEFLKFKKFALNNQHPLSEIIKNYERSEKLFSKKKLLLKTYSLLKENKISPSHMNEFMKKNYKSDINIYKSTSENCENLSIDKSLLNLKKLTEI